MFGFIARKVFVPVVVGFVTHRLTRYLNSKVDDRSTKKAR